MCEEESIYDDEQSCIFCGCEKGTCDSEECSCDICVKIKGEIK